MGIWFTVAVIVVFVLWSRHANKKREAEIQRIIRSGVEKDTS